MGMFAQLRYKGQWQWACTWCLDNRELGDNHRVTKTRSAWRRQIGQGAPFYFDLVMFKTDTPDLKGIFLCRRFPIDPTRELTGVSSCWPCKQQAHKCPDYTRFPAWIEDETLIPTDRILGALEYQHKHKDDIPKLVNNYLLDIVLRLSRGVSGRVKLTALGLRIDGNIPKYNLTGAWDDGGRRVDGGECFVRL